MPRKKKPKKTKPVTVELIDYKDPLYLVLGDLVKKHHPRLAESKARILLAWKKGWKVDSGGKIVLGQAVKATDLSRELEEHDFVILLNADIIPHLEDSRQRGILDHELCHCDVIPEDDDFQRDDRDRLVLKMNKHDLEEFCAVVERHGFYVANIQEFARAILNRPAGDRSLFDDDEDSDAALEAQGEGDVIS